MNCCKPTPSSFRAKYDLVSKSAYFLSLVRSQPQFDTKRGHESSLIVPANSPNCSSDDDNSGSVFLPGPRERPMAPDSDFGASAGVSHYNVSSNTSLHLPEESLASNSYVWDGYDPSFRRRPLSYVDGAYYPVLGEKQYWV